MRRMRRMRRMSSGCFWGRRLEGRGGKLVIRSGLREGNLRFFVAWVGDVFGKASFWMKTAPVHYPTVGFMREVLEGVSLRKLE
jgi:hypothetical protein